jgi:hypothetical protein
VILYVGVAVCDDVVSFSSGNLIKEMEVGGDAPIGYSASEVVLRSVCRFSVNVGVVHPCRLAHVTLSDVIVCRVLGFVQSATSTCIVFLFFMNYGKISVNLG